MQYIVNIYVFFILTFEIYFCIFFGKLKNIYYIIFLKIDFFIIFYYFTIIFLF